MTAVIFIDNFDVSATPELRDRPAPVLELLRQVSLEGQNL